MKEVAQEGENIPLLIPKAFGKEGVRGSYEILAE